jgi:hypothetical protein
LCVDAQGEREIGAQMALVEFIEDHELHPLERQIGLQAPGEDALGQHLDARAL